MSRLRAVLLHGMGNAADWWNPLLPALRALGIEVYAPELPDLERSGPEAWVEAVKTAGGCPDLIIGHSLGAAAALVAAVRYGSENVICLAMPAAAAGALPAIPTDSSLSVTALARIGLFLQAATALEVPSQVKERVHLIGGGDVWTNGEALAAQGFRCVTAPAAGHELNESSEARALLVRCIAELPVARRTLDPAVRLAAIDETGGGIHNLALDETAPAPVRLDIEITSRCNLNCRFCGRTLYNRGSGGSDMTPEIFETALGSSSACREVIFVGLGEPLLHPGAAAFVGRAHDREIRTWMVTNGTVLPGDLPVRLATAGLDEITFSIDAADERLFAELRGGASFERVTAHLHAVQQVLPVSLFTTLSRSNAGELTALIDLAASFGLPALTVSNLNFPENGEDACTGEECIREIERAIRHASEQGILLLGPHIHDFPSVTSALRSCRITSAEDITQRPERHTHCLAPWRILVVGANGDITPCNCAPEMVAGNILRQPFATIWNGEVMGQWRAGLLDGSNECCRSCPRF